MSLDTKEQIMEYAGVMQQDAFHSLVIREVHGRTQISCKLDGIPMTLFKPVRAPYTRQYLRHIPILEPQEIKAAHDHKPAPKDPKGRGKAFRRVTGRHKGTK